jgi:hypothetical protein
MTVGSRRGKVNVLAVLLLLIVAVGGYGAYLLVPPYLDYMNMKEVASSAALAWYATETKTGSEKKFDEQMRAKEIDYITRDDCKWEESKEIFAVYCYWEYDVFYVPTDYYKTLEFEVTAESDKRGVVDVY